MCVELDWLIFVFDFTDITRARGEENLRTEFRRIRRRTEEPRARTPGGRRLLTTAAASGRQAAVGDAVAFRTLRTGRGYEFRERPTRHGIRCCSTAVRTGGTCTPVNWVLKGR